MDNADAASAGQLVYNLQNVKLRMCISRGTRCAGRAEFPLPILRLLSYRQPRKLLQSPHDKCIKPNHFMAMVKICRMREYFVAEFCVDNEREPRQ